MATQRSLRRREEFVEVLRKGTKVSGSPGLSLSVLCRSGGPGRLGVAATARGAVQRNRIKRRLRAAFRDARTRSVDVVARADSRIARADYQELVSTFRGVCGRQDQRGALSSGPQDQGALSSGPQDLKGGWRS